MGKLSVSFINTGGSVSHRRLRRMKATIRWQWMALRKQRRLLENVADKNIRSLCNRRECTTSVWDGRKWKGRAFKINEKHWTTGRRRQEKNPNSPGASGAMNEQTVIRQGKWENSRDWRASSALFQDSIARKFELIPRFVYSWTGGRQPEKNFSTSSPSVVITILFYHYIRAISCVRNATEFTVCIRLCIVILLVAI